ncbi:MAG: DUF4373 domain-containing protein [Prevotellaceae bacterium]|jgi:hypothetical protein|nr:DUF4373 domain-containing protein [Prevotellaceae bacterium]
MARPNKIGLDYFPFDVDFFNDEKIGAISGEFGIKGELACIKLLCAIYRQGYFILWNEMLKMKLIKELPGVSADLLDNIVSRLIRWGFFDKTLFEESGILTSKGIQRRYFEIVKRRVDTGTNLPYLLVSAYNNRVSAYINPVSNGVSAYINPQSKVKESKVNLKEKEKKKKPPSGFIPPSVDEVKNYISEKKYSVDAEVFVAFYTSKDWFVGKSKMRDWRAALVTWQKRSKNEKHTGIDAKTFNPDGGYTSTI